jgi:hypothetical protein
MLKVLEKDSVIKVQRIAYISKNVVENQTLPSRLETSFLLHFFFLFKGCVRGEREIYPKKKNLKK